MRLLTILLTALLVLGVTVQAKGIHGHRRRPRHLSTTRPEVPTGIPTVPLHELTNRKLGSDHTKRQPTNMQRGTAILPVESSTKTSRKIKTPMMPNNQEAVRVYNPKSTVARTTQRKMMQHESGSPHPRIHIVGKMKPRRVAKSGVTAAKKLQKKHMMKNQVRADRVNNKHRNLNRKMLKNAMAKHDSNIASKYRANLKAKLARKNMAARAKSLQAKVKYERGQGNQMVPRESMRKYMAKKHYWKKQQAKKEMEKKFKYAKADKQPKRTNVKNAK